MYTLYTLFKNTPTMLQINITTPATEKLIKNLNIHKAAVPDQIAPRVLKELAADVLGPILTSIYRRLYETGKVPLVWKSANVVPSFKKREKCKPSNYCPVSLTCIWCKIMVHIVMSKIMAHIVMSKIMLHIVMSKMMAHIVMSKIMAHIVMSKIMAHIVMSKIMVHIAMSKIMAHIVMSKIIAHIVMSKIMAHVVMSKIMVHIVMSKIMAHIVMSKIISLQQTTWHFVQIPAWLPQVKIM